eukprot:693021-Rhodomonas_salina.2
MCGTGIARGFPQRVIRVHRTCFAMPGIDVCYQVCGSNADAANTMLCEVRTLSVYQCARKSQILT